ncbi:MAG: hypothetical protein IJU40_06445, partial [Desulfovibrionaceae bacterium]|nr:hypothetical protein [Desulfovibrionaceae bacterium]
VVIREERANLVEALGADLFNYALMRGQYQVGEALRIFKQKNLNLPLLKRCKLEGWLALKLCALAWPLELQQLFLERLKRLFKEEDLNLTISLKANDRNILWNLLKKCLLREVDPSWTQYFTS